jgi:hypothetical protein
MAKITKVPDGPLIKKKGPFKGSTLKAGGKIIKKAQAGVTQEGNTYTSTKKVNTGDGPRYYQGKSMDMSTAMKMANFKSRANPSDSIPKINVPTKTLESLNKKDGGMIKRADGSKSKRGLWDNIRANKGSGKKPTTAMLKQEKKIKAKK